MESLLRDARYALRMLRKSPGFTAVAVLTLALGIGANTAIFSLVNAVLLRPLPFKDANRLVVLFETNLKEAEKQAPPTPADFRDWRDRSDVFEELVAWRNWSYSVEGTSQAEEVLGTRVSAGFFRMVGVKPYLGRAFSTDEEQVGRDHVVVLSYGFWQRRFAGARDVLGKTLTIDGKPFVILGVLPASFRFLPTRTVDLWMPLAFTASDLKRGNHSIAVWGRLKPGVSLGQAQAELSGIAYQLAQAYPNTNADWNVQIVPWRESMVRDIRPSLLLLSGAVWLVLMLACANVASLLVARSAREEKEVAIRRALGSGSWRLIRQLLTESALLALFGGAMGLLLAFLGLKVLLALIPSGILPRLNEIGVDRQALAFTCGLSLLTGFLFGLAPARYASKVDLTEALKEGGASSSPSLHRSRLSNLLVVFEFALAVMLLAGAGLMIQSFVSLRAINPGFDPKNVLTMEISLASSKYSSPQQVADFYQQVLGRIDILPGVRYGAAVDFLPLTFDVRVPVAIEGRPATIPGQETMARYRVISPAYFRAMDIPLLKGRYFTEQDTGTAPGAMIVNQDMANRFWPGQDVIGKRVRPMFPESQAPWYALSNGEWLTIVGVVPNVRDEPLNAEVEPEMYMSYPQAPSSTMYLVIRTASDPAPLVPAIRSAIQGLDKGEPVFDVRPMEELVSESISRPRFNMIVLSIFAGLALVLAMTGIYAMISHWASQRTHEIGIRMSLGAQPRDVLRLVTGQGVRLALTGVVIGLAAAFGLTRAMTSVLYGAGASNPLIFGSVAILLLFVALAACYIPARRAMRVDPMVALRHE